MHSEQHPRFNLTSLIEQKCLSAATVRAQWMINILSSPAPTRQSKGSSTQLVFSTHCALPLLCAD